MNILFYGILTVTILVLIQNFIKYCYFKQVGRKMPGEVKGFRWEKLLAFPFGLETICALRPSFFTPDAPMGNDAFYNNSVFMSDTHCYAHSLGLEPGIGKDLGAITFQKATLEERLTLGVHPWSDALMSSGKVKHAKLRLKAEGLVKVTLRNLFSNRARRGVVLFVFDAKANSYHFYKLNQNGWSSKAGETPVSRFDDRGKKIRNPRLSVLNTYRYTTVGAYFVYYDESALRKNIAKEQKVNIKQLAVV